jgi:hypothetical protein
MLPVTAAAATAAVDTMTWRLSNVGGVISLSPGWADALSVVNAIRSYAKLK